LWLSSTIIDHLEECYRNDPSKVLAYWYFDFGDSDTQNIDNLMSSAIRQLCAGVQNLPDVIRELWEKHRARNSRPSTKELAKILNSVIVSLDEDGKDGFLVMDALDECPETAGRQYVLDQIIELKQNHKNFHILVTSRKEGDIHDSLENVATAVSINDSIVGDLELFAQDEIAKMMKGNPWKEKWRAKMETSIIGTQETFVSPPLFVSKREIWLIIQLGGFVGPPCSFKRCRAAAPNVRSWKP